MVILHAINNSLLTSWKIYDRWRDNNVTAKKWKNGEN